MVFTQKEKEIILKEFPSFQLCYEEPVRSKVYSKISSPLYVAIAKGPKCFIWFTLYKGQPTCFVLEQDRKSNNIRNIEIRHACFHETLCIGTVLHGVLVKRKGQQFCVVDDIYFYKGTFVGLRSSQIKLEYLEHFFSEIRIVHYSQCFIVFALAIMNTSKSALLNRIEHSGYVPYCIQYRNLEKLAPYLNERYVVDKSVVLLIRPDFKNDIYNYFCTRNKTACADGILNIPDYKTSVMMNSLFRKIKENSNLDMLEESDSEDEFENVSEDKYIINKELYMVCSFNSYIKRWQPVKLSNSSTLTSREMLRYLEKM